MLEIIKSLKKQIYWPIKYSSESSADRCRFNYFSLINTFFSKGIFPEKLKIVTVIPLHKGGSTQDLNNFRPISLLSIFDKIIEKSIHKKLYHLLDLHNILFENQFGFRKNNSTPYALMEITEKIKEY